MAKLHTSELTTMRYFFTIGVLLAVAASKSSPDVQIENKNINVIVNADSKQIARELWKIIERHLKRNRDSFTRRSDSQESETVEELEKVIKSAVQPSRRSGPPTDEELAKNFEIIVRRALPPTETYGSDPINDIVDDMLTATRKSLNRTSAIIKSKREETAGEKPSLIGGSDGYSRASLLTAHQIMRSLKNIKKSVKNCVFMKKGVPDDFPVTLDHEFHNDLDQSKNKVRIRSSEAAGQPPHSYYIVEVSICHGGEIELRGKKPTRMQSLISDMKRMMKC